MQKAFLQVTNLCFRTEEDLKLDLSSQTTSLSPTEALRRCREFVLQNKRLGSIAAKLMGCDSVRLYHDQVGCMTMRIHVTICLQMVNERANCNCRPFTRRKLAVLLHGTAIRYDMIGRREGK